MSRAGKITAAVLLLIAAASGLLILAGKSAYAAGESALEEVRLAMDAAGLCEEAGVYGKTERKESGDPGSQPGKELRQEAAKQREPQLPEELFGRLGISEIGLDLPVMRPPEEEPEKYLFLGPDGRKSVYGSVYTDPTADFASDTLILYGHHMKNGAMFGSIETLGAAAQAVLIAPEGIRTYRFTEKFTVTPEDREALEALSLPAEKRRLVLVTCAYERPDERLIVLFEEP